MAELKTKKSELNVADFIKGIDDEGKRADCRRLLSLMGQITGERPAMWGTSIVGFGSYHYRYDSGQEGDWFLTGFSPRKQALTLYIMSGFTRYGALMKKLGKYRTGKACLYLKRLDDVDPEILEDLIRESVAHKRKTEAPVRSAGK